MLASMRLCSAANHGSICWVGSMPPPALFLLNVKQFIDYVRELRVPIEEQ